MKESDGFFMKFLIGMLIFACGPIGIALYALGKRSKS